MKKIKEQIIKLVKIENSIADIFYKLCCFECDNYQKKYNLKDNYLYQLLQDALKIEQKYINNIIIDNIKYFIYTENVTNKSNNYVEQIIIDENENNPILNMVYYVVKNYADHNYFLEDYEENENDKYKNNLIYERILNQLSIANIAYNLKELENGSFYNNIIDNSYKELLIKSGYLNKIQQELNTYFIDTCFEIDTSIMWTKNISKYISENNFDNINIPKTLIIQKYKDAFKYCYFSELLSLPMKTRLYFVYGKEKIDFEYRERTFTKDYNLIYFLEDFIQEYDNNSFVENKEYAIEDIIYNKCYINTIFEIINDDDIVIEYIDTINNELFYNKEKDFSNYSYIYNLLKKYIEDVKENIITKKKVKK